MYRSGQASHYSMTPSLTQKHQPENKMTSSKLRRSSVRKLILRFIIITMAVVQLTIMTSIKSIAFIPTHPSYYEPTDGRLQPSEGMTNTVTNLTESTTHNNGNTTDGASSSPVSPSPLISKSSSSPWQKGYREDRVIAFIHVGKAGGMSIRQTTVLGCNPIDEKRSKGCAGKFFPAETGKHVLATQTRHYFHLWGHPGAKAILLNNTKTTSFLFSIRNPIDRIISSYRYSHPENCNPSTRKYEPWSCTVLDKHIKKAAVAKAYRTCFPSASMEYFAQSSMSISHSSLWATTSSSTLSRTGSTNHNAVSSSEKLPSNFLHADCRSIARDMLRGRYTDAANPHMTFNYEYYVQQTLEATTKSLDDDDQYREVFVIRTEHEKDDMEALDMLIGGDGKLIRRSPHHSWGSEHYKDSPLSPVALAKLCCMLEREIDYYFLLLDQSLNLSEMAKEESRLEVKERCTRSQNGAAIIGEEDREKQNKEDHYALDDFPISSPTLLWWAEWSSECRRHLQANELGPLHN